MVRVAFALVVASGLLCGCRTAALTPASGSASDHDHRSEHASEHAHEEHERPPAFGWDLRRGWCAPIDHAHESRCGTPYVHAFHLEPAFLGRDVLVHLENEGEEHALEVEVEYALTRRLLLVPEVPYHWTEDEDGVGDAGLGLRALLVETNPFLLSAQAGFEFPTAQRDLGADEVGASQSLLAWADLGSCFTAQGGLTLSEGVESGDVGFSWGAALGKSFRYGPLLGGCSRRSDHGHESFFSVLLEGRGEYALSGPEDGASEHELLLGFDFPLTTGLDLRAGWNLRWDEESDAEPGWVAGFVVHF